MRLLREAATLHAERPTLVRAPERIVPGARAIALAAGRTQSSAFVWDGRRVHATTGSATIYQSVKRRFLPGQTMKPVRGWSIAG